MLTDNINKTKDNAADKSASNAFLINTNLSTKNITNASLANTTKNRFMVNDARLATLNKAYYFGEYDLPEYRQLRDQLIDEITQKDLAKEDITQRINTIQQHHTIKIESQKTHTVAVRSIIPPNESLESQNGPSVMQFLWVSVAVILFIYMYTATID